MKDPVPDYTIVKGDDRPATITNLGNNLAPRSDESGTCKHIRRKMMTDQDSDMAVNCSRSNNSDHSGDDTEAMDNDESERLR